MVEKFKEKDCLIYIDSNWLENATNCCFSSSVFKNSAVLITFKISAFFLSNANKIIKIPVFAKKNQKSKIKKSKNQKIKKSINKWQRDEHSTVSYPHSGLTASLFGGFPVSVLIIINDATSQLCQVNRRQLSQWSFNTGKSTDVIFDPLFSSIHLFLWRNGF